MVKKGEFVSFANNLEVKGKSTEMQVLIELSKKVLAQEIIISNLKVRIEALETKINALKI